MSHSKPVRAKRRSLAKLISAGQSIGVPIEATFKEYSFKHVLLIDADHPGGHEKHLWINGRAATFMPPLHKGDRIKFRADLHPYYEKNDDCLSVRLECVREVSVFSPEVA